MTLTNLERLDVSDDIQGLQQFYDALSEEKETFELSFELIQESHEAWIVRNEAKEIVGLSGLRKKWGCSIFYVVVNKSEQGKGLGRILTEQCLKNQHFVMPLLLSVENSNKKAQTLYESLGMGKVLCLKSRTIMMQKVGPWRLLCYLSQFWTKGPSN